MRGYCASGKYHKRVVKLNIFFTVRVFFRHLIFAQWKQHSLRLDETKTRICMLILSRGKNRKKDIRIICRERTVWRAVRGEKNICLNMYILSITFAIFFAEVLTCNAGW